MSEKDTQQQTGNKYGIDREKIRNAKNYKPFPGANKGAAGNQEANKESRFKLDLYQKIVIAITVVVSVLYCAVYTFAQKGQMLINTATQYWLWFAVVICVILLVGRFVMKLPKRESTRKALKMGVAIVSLILIYMTYLSCVESIEAGWAQCAEITSEDGKHSVVVMRIDVDLTGDEEETAETEAAEETDKAESYTLYSAYPRINKYFCDNTAQDNLIMIRDGLDVELKMEWIDGDLRLYVEEKALEGMDSILVELN